MGVMCILSSHGRSVDILLSHGNAVHIVVAWEICGYIVITWECCENCHMGELCIFLLYIVVTCEGCAYCYHMGVLFIWTISAGATVKLLLPTVVAVVIMWMVLRQSCFFS